MQKVAFKISDNSIHASSSYAGPSVVLGLIHTGRLPLLLRLRYHFASIAFSCTIFTLSDGKCRQTSKQIIANANA